MKLPDNIAVGVDVESIARFKNLDRAGSKTFLNRIFTKRELEYCYSKKDPAQHLAVRFAGKEAVIKALASLGLKTLPRNNIEILKDKIGAPSVRVSSNHRKESPIFKISLSHANNHALAFVIVMKRYNK